MLEILNSMIKYLIAIVIILFLLSLCYAIISGTITTMTKNKERKRVIKEAIKLIDDINKKEEE